MKSSKENDNYKVADINSMKSLIEDNFNDLLVFFASKNKLNHYIGDKISWVNSSPNCWPNFIFKTNLQRKDINEDLDKIILGIKKKSFPLFGYWDPECMFQTSVQ